MAQLQDPWNVALSEAIKMVANSGLQSAESVSVCGEAASGPLFAAVFTGLGVTSLSWFGKHRQVERHVITM